MAISADQVKTLREQTGAGIMDCKRALQEAEGDMAKASNVLRQQGLAKAEKKSGRAAQQGLVEPYIHAGGRIGVIVEINCETDFVARTPDFRALAHDVALQIAATNPRVVQASDLDETTLAALDAEYGSRDKALEAVALLNQPYIKDPKQAISDLVRDAIAKLGENIIIRRFSRFEVGADQPASEAEESR